MTTSSLRTPAARLGLALLSSFAFLAFQTGKADESMFFGTCETPQGYFYCEKSTSNPCDGIQTGCKDIIRQGIYPPPPCDAFPGTTSVAMVFTSNGGTWSMCGGTSGLYPYECAASAAQCGTAELYTGSSGCDEVDFCGLATVSACYQTANGQTCTP